MRNLWFKLLVLSLSILFIEIRLCAATIKQINYANGTIVLKLEKNEMRQLVLGKRALLVAQSSALLVDSWVIQAKGARLTVKVITNPQGLFEGMKVKILNEKGEVLNEPKPPPRHQTMNIQGSYAMRHIQTMSRRFTEYILGFHYEFKDPYVLGLVLSFQDAEPETLRPGEFHRDDQFGVQGYYYKPGSWFEPYVGARYIVFSRGQAVFVRPADKNSHVRSEIKYQSSGAQLLFGLNLRLTSTFSFNLGGDLGQMRLGSVNFKSFNVERDSNTIRVNEDHKYDHFMPSYYKSSAMEMGITVSF